MWFQNYGGMGTTEDGNALLIDTTEDPDGPPVKVESNVPPRVRALLKVSDKILPTVCSRTKAKKPKCPLK